MASRSQMHSSLQAGSQEGGSGHVDISRGAGRRAAGWQQQAEKGPRQRPAVVQHTFCALPAPPQTAPPRPAPVLSRAGKHAGLLRAPLHDCHGLRMVVEGEGGGSRLAAVPHPQRAIGGACRSGGIWGKGGGRAEVAGREGGCNNCRWEHAMHGGQLQLDVHKFEASE